MPVIDTTGLPVADDWTLAEDAAPGPRAVLPLKRFLAEAAAGRVAGGVSLAPGERLDALLPHLPALGLVAIAFPKFRDGRGFTTAKLLRERHGFHGGIRAIGDVLPDQFAMLRDCGFTTVLTPDSQPPERWQAILAAPAMRAAPRAAQLLQRLVPRPEAG